MLPEQDFQLQIKTDIPLKAFTTFHIGGPAELFVEASTESELQQAVLYAQTQNIPWFILGGGSNLVVSDKGMDGLVIRNRASETAVYDPDQGLLTVSSGHKLGDVVELAQKKSLRGLEVFSGIPGSFGGAVCGNAGAYGRSIGDLLTKATVIFPDGTVQVVTNSFFEFAYRTSILKRVPYVLLNATLKVEQTDDSQAILDQMHEIITQRKGKHPPRHVGCAGSFFKNLPPLPGQDRRRAAGKILEDAGAKQLSYGGASVYERHANFIVNYGDASAEDVRQLAQMLKKIVHEKFSIELQEEVRYVGR